MATTKCQYTRGVPPNLRGLSRILWTYNLLKGQYDECSTLIGVIPQKEMNGDMIHGARLGSWHPRVLHAANTLSDSSEPKMKIMQVSPTIGMDTTWLVPYWRYYTLPSPGHPSLLHESTLHSGGYARLWQGSCADWGRMPHSKLAGCCDAQTGGVHYYAAFTSKNHVISCLFKNYHWIACLDFLCPFSLPGRCIHP